MMKPATYVNARLLDAGMSYDKKGGIVVSNGVIEDWGEHITAGQCGSDRMVVDCKGLCLTAGLIDMLMYLRQPGGEHKETIRSALTAAAHGGVTSVVATADSDPPIDTLPMVGFIERKARETKRSKLYPTATLTRGGKGTDLTNMGLLKEAGAIAFGDELNLYSIKRLYEAMLHAVAHDCLIVYSLAEPSFSGGVMNEGFLATKLGVEGIPSFTEAMMLEQIIQLVRVTGARTHVNLVTTKESVALMRRSKDEGLPLTAGTAPPYFLLTEDAIGNYQTSARLIPPLRGELDRLEIIKAIKESVIDVIVSAHAPQDIESKQLPFSQAAAGAVGLETLLPLSLQLYHEGHCTLLDWLRMLTSAPASILRLPSGALHKGHAADLVCFDKDKKSVIKSASFRSQSRNTPFEDYQIKGVIDWVLVDGMPVTGEDMMERHDGEA